MKENIESLQRIRLIMDYDVSKTLYENTIQEQDIFDPSYVPNYESTFDFIQWMKTWNTHDCKLLEQIIRHKSNRLMTSASIFSAIVGKSRSMNALQSASLASRSYLQTGEPEVVL